MGSWVPGNIFWILLPPKRKEKTDSRCLYKIRFMDIRWWENVLKETNVILTLIFIEPRLSYLQSGNKFLCLEHLIDLWWDPIMKVKSFRKLLDATKAGRITAISSCSLPRKNNWNCVHVIIDVHCVHVIIDVRGSQTILSPTLDELYRACLIKLINHQHGMKCLQR